ncbi:MAG: hypothetical protein IPM74_06280 [Crocinitomicaceae bacterium]|nr:hypothetical protein [Crocinitomicaceae bacterium]MBK8925512.1 hypothetical protein [Crocinitomicaceae bacterium]
MKKTIVMLAAGALLLATPSCKKGENDPFLSLSSRKARISGEWTVSGYESSYENHDGSDVWTGTETFNGTTITGTWSQTVGGVTTSGNDSETRTVSLYDVIINKDGTYEMHMNMVTVSTGTNWGGFDYTDTETSTSTEMGSWSFVGKAKDEYKNKERVALNTTHTVYTSQTTTVTDLGGGVTDTYVGDTDTYDNTYEIGENSTIMDIDMLKGKEMTWKMVSGGTNIMSSTTSGGTTTTSTTTDSDQMTITLTAK